MKQTLSALIAFLFFVNQLAAGMDSPEADTLPVDPVMTKIIELGNTDNRCMEHLDMLCNRFGGRLIGSDAYENAALWAAGKFEEWGMQVFLDEVGALPVGFNRGPWFGKLLAEEGMALHFATPSYTLGTKGVQRGPVLIEPRSQKEFDRMKGALKGAWVLIEGENNGFPIDISIRADSIRNTQKELKDTIIPALFYREMVEAGILGIIQKSKTPIRVMYDRKNLPDMSWDKLPPVPDIKLDEHQYEKIYQMAKERRYFQLEFDIRNHWKPGPVPFHNVIGVIPGTEFPDEYVIMSGHLDAYDVATGGVDDGSGVSPTMEAARLIMEAGGKPKRTILAILWAGEEFGLLGSQSWVDRFDADLVNVSNMVNRDGGPTVPVALSVSEAQRADFEPIVELINSVNPEFPVELKDRKPRSKPEKAWGTDSGPFAVEGVPTITFECGDPRGYNFSYREIWHTERDLYNKSIPVYQEQAAIATAVLVYGLANLDHLLSREGYYIEKEEKPVGKKGRKSGRKTGK